MSINHFSSDLPETLWWTQQQQPMMESTPNTSSSNQKLLIPQQNHLWPSQIYNPHHHQHQQWLGPFNSQEATPSMFHNRNTPLNFNLNEEDDEETEEQITDERENFHYQEHQQHHQQEEEIVEAEREPMFEKPLTPSDVGKLNRLVIPKQHAEKYFPLGGGGGGGDSTEKGLLLSFEDELGKCWRFRYSYWNSSQSYVLTKGWSRYVKEKRLDAGDVVLFERHRSDGDKLFIGWRRRAPQAQDSGAALQPGGGGGGGGGNIGGTSSGGWTRVFYSAHPYPPHPLPYQPDCLHAGSVGQSQTTPAGNWKRVRLFGVNLECQLHDDSEPPTPDGSSSSSQGGQTTHHQFYPEPPASAAHTPMDTNFSRDVNHMRNRRG